MAEKIEYKYICPCCNQKGIEERGISDVCCFCGWEEDFLQENNPDYKGGANRMSLNEVRAAYAEGREVR